MFGRIIIAVACVAMVGAGCEKSSSSSSGSPSAAQALPVVKLIDPGTGPKQQLRLKPVAGWKQTVVMKMNMTMAMDAGPALQVPRTEMPLMIMTMLVTVSQVDKAGNAHYDLVMSDLDVEPGNANPRLVEAIRPSLAKLKGFKGHATVNPRNFTIAGEFEVPPGVDASTKQMLDSMSQSIGQLSAPVPEEAVGVGARWNVDATMPTTSVKLKQTAEYTITKLEGDHVSLAVKIAQTADPQEMKAPGMPAGSKLSVTSWQGTGSGNVEFELGKQILPSHATVSIGEHAKFMIEASDQKQPMSMDLDIALEL